MLFYTVSLPVFALFASYIASSQISRRSAPSKHPAFSFCASLVLFSYLFYTIIFVVFFYIYRCVNISYIYLFICPLFYRYLSEIFKKIILPLKVKY